MITAILDTNVVVQSVLSTRRGSSAQVIDACLDHRFRPIYSPSTIQELLEVLTVPHIRARHGLSDDQVLELVASVTVHADTHHGVAAVSAAITRDVTDTKFLSLAAESSANYLVTNDRRHLLPLKHFQATRIVTPTAFLRRLR